MDQRAVADSLFLTQGREDAKGKTIKIFASLR